MRFDESASFSLDRRQCLLGLGALTGMALAQGRAAFGSTIDLQVATALDLSAGLNAGTWSARELAQHYLGRIEALNGPFERFDDNGALNAFIRTFPDLARLGWERADHARPYADWSGVPVALKDVYSVQGKPLTVGTPAHRSYRAPKDCTLWRKWSDAGAVLLGHTQAQRFISGLETPQTANPWTPRLIVGGSSGGSAAAVAAGLVPIALGGETNGSLICPALCCAVTTLKPSLGLLSLAGSFPGCQSLDVGGPLARSAADCAWALATLAGVDSEDPMTAEQQGSRSPGPICIESRSPALGRCGGCGSWSHRTSVTRMKRRRAARTRLKCSAMPIRASARASGIFWAPSPRSAPRSCRPRFPRSWGCAVSSTGRTPASAGIQRARFSPRRTT